MPRKPEVVVARERLERAPRLARASRARAFRNRRSPAQVSALERRELGLGDVVERGAGARVVFRGQVAQFGKARTGIAAFSPTDGGLSNRASQSHAHYLRKRPWGGGKTSLRGGLRRLAASSAKGSTANVP